MIGIITEGVTQAATAAIDAFKGAPVLLALVILQGLTLAIVGYNVQQRQKDIAEERKLFAAERAMFIEHCVIPRAKEP